MEPQMTNPSRPGRHARLLLSAAVGGIAAVAAAGAAHAQAFNGTPGVVAGTATRTVTGPTTETIQVDSASAIINWKPNLAGSGTIIFLPAGNVATFQNGLNNPDFAVLNRIIPGVPDRPIALNGQVIS